MENHKKIKKNKLKLLWVANAAIFVSVVYMGISQAGSGALLAKYEDELTRLNETRSEIEGNIFNLTNHSVALDRSKDLGFVKPTDFIYIDNPDSYAAILAK